MFDVDDFQAIKGMDDNTLNIHLSSLCNSLTDAATDVIKVGALHMVHSIVVLLVE